MQSSEGSASATASEAPTEAMPLAGSSPLEPCTVFSNNDYDHNDCDSSPEPEALNPSLSLKHKKV